VAATIRARPDAATAARMRDAASLALLVVPGPAVLYIVGRSLNHGRRAGVLSVLGICTGTLCHVVAAALGLTAVLRASPIAFSAIRYAGAAYLVWLGLRALRSGEASIGTDSGRRRDAPMQIFRQGVLVNVLNPKTALFFLAFLPQFVDPARGAVGVQVLVLGGLFVALSLVSDGMYALLAGTFGQYLQGEPRFLRAQRYLTSGIFVALGLIAAFA
jgi:threonine/homoserine/homoserine lactone efflux protein